jgi:hypothetical protein
LLTDLDVVYKRSPFEHFHAIGAGRSGIWIGGDGTGINTGTASGHRPQAASRLHGSRVDSWEPPTGDGTYTEDK